jgi:hypothetical protein
MFATFRNLRKQLAARLRGPRPSSARDRRARLFIESLEDRKVSSSLRFYPMAAVWFPPIDEVGNTLAHPTEGTVGTDWLRASVAAYADGVSSASLPQNPSARVISDRDLQADVFKFAASISGTVSAAATEGCHESAARGMAGITVELLDASGNVLATTVTDRLGYYRFDQLTGFSGTGRYTVQLVLPSGQAAGSAATATVNIDCGGRNRDGVDFTVGQERQFWNVRLALAAKKALPGLFGGEIDE